MKRLLPRFGAWAILLAVALVCASCASVLGDDFTLATCGDETTCSSCAGCVTSADCQSQFDACEGDADCRDLLTCESGCTSSPDYESCIATCEQDHVDGTAVYGSLSACTCNACSTPCAGCSP